MNILAQYLLLLEFVVNFIITYILFLCIKFDNFPKIRTRDNSDM